MDNELKIFYGNANRDLALEVCSFLGVAPGEAELTKFPDGEIYFHVLENVRGADVFIIQPTCHPVNDNLIELLIMIDTFKRASARRITAVIPYYGYARQDRKDKPRVPISAKLVADLITAAGANRILTMDLHADQIMGFFNIPVDHLYALPVLLEHIKSLRLANLAIVAPDTGGVQRARAYAKRLAVELVIVDKRRVEPETPEILHIIGDVFGRNLIVVDDMITTAGTLVQTLQELKKGGAVKIYAAATHPVLAGPAIERLRRADLEEIFVTNTIPVPPEKRLHNLRVLSVAMLLGEAIKSIHDETSVSRLFV